MKSKLLLFILVGWIMSGSAFAQCDVLTKYGLFDQGQFANDEERISSFVRWAREQKGNISNSSGGGGGSINVFDLFGIEGKGNTTSSSNAWHDIENYASGDDALKSRVRS